MVTTYLDIVVRSSLIYFAVVLGLRLLGKRHVAQLTILDLVLVLLISNGVQNAMVGSDVSLVGGIVSAATLLLLNFILSKIIYRSGAAGKFIEGTPTLLIHDGEAVLAHLQQEQITLAELEGAIREHGIERISDVKFAVMEPDGVISVIRMAHGEKRFESFKHRRATSKQFEAKP